MTTPTSRIRRLALAAMITAASVLAVGCTAAEPEQQPGGEAGASFPLTVQNCGREVTIEQAPERVYVIGGEAGTLVHAAGGSDRVATFAPLAEEPLGEAEAALAAAEQAPIKTITDLSREAVIGANPDLVVTFGLNDFTPEDLQSAGIPTLIISGYCGGFGAGQSEVEDPLGGVFADVETLGRVFGTEDAAKQAADGLRGRVAAVRERADGTPPQPAKTAAVFVPGPDGGLGAYGRRSMIHQQMSYLGLSNVFEGTDERYFEPNTESLIGARPERMIALYEAADTTEDEVRQALTGREQLAEIPAVANTEILVLDFYYSGHGTLAVDGLEQLAEQLGG